MLRSQRQIVDKLGLDLPDGSGAGETADAIRKHLRAKGIPKGKVIKKLLEKRGYIKVVRIPWKGGYKQRIRLLKRLKNAPRTSLAVARIEKDRLGLVLAAPETGKQLRKALKAKGIAIVRWHKTEGRLTVEAYRPQQIGVTRGGAEGEALRTYVAGLKKKYAGSSMDRFKALERLAKRCGVKYRKFDKDGVPLGIIPRNLQCSISLRSAAKRNNVLRKELGLKPIKKIKGA